jgi:hypothetical protein
MPLRNTGSPSQHHPIDYANAIQLALVTPPGICAVDAINYLMDLRKAAMVKMEGIATSMISQMAQASMTDPPLEVYHEAA